MANRARSSRSHVQRRSERFLTSAVSCPIGDVVDVSDTGLRLASTKRFRFKIGETHQLVLRAGGQQLRASMRVQWVRRVSLFPVRYEAGFQLVDARPGVGKAIRQMGQFGCATNDSVDAATPEEAKEQATPTVQASIEIEDLYAVLGVEKDASADEIKSAYRRLAREHHPDRSEAQDAAEVFDRIAKAYSILGDTRRRKWYDQMASGEIAA